MSQIKELINENKTKKVLVFRSEDKATKNGFNYYLTVLLWNAMFGGFWVINDNYKQILDITSLKVAERISIDLLNTEII